MSALREDLSGLRARLLDGHVVLLPSPREDGKRRPHLVLDADEARATVVPSTHHRPGTLPGDIVLEPVEKPHLGLDDRPTHHGRPCALRTAWRRSLDLAQISRLAGPQMTPAAWVPGPPRQLVRHACAQTRPAGPTAAGAGPRPPARRPDERED